MRVLPLGVPKLMVSTLASGAVGHFVGTADVLMLHSVVDIAGLNRISRPVLARAGRLPKVASTLVHASGIASIALGIVWTLRTLVGG